MEIQSLVRSLAVGSLDCDAMDADMDPSDRWIRWILRVDINLVYALLDGITWIPYSVCCLGWNHLGESTPTDTPNAGAAIG